MTQPSSSARNAKRQRQKEQRRMKIQEEMRRYQAKRRKRMGISLLVVVLAVGGTFGFLQFQEAREKEQARQARIDAAAAASPLKRDCTAKTVEEQTPKQVSPPKSPTEAERKKKYTATIETSEGTIEMELSNAVSPCTVNSFVHLVRAGFYDGLTFHRLVKDFALQGGDPTGTGSSGPGYKVVDPPPKDFKYVKGTVAMAKAGAEADGTAGSQFFIVPGDGAASLPAQYAILGKVISGDEAIAKINALAQPDEKPAKPVTIVKITVEEG